MKVYELMAQLNSFPAGADVEFKTIIPLSDITTGNTECIDGEKIFHYSSSIIETEINCGGNLVHLYG